MLIALTILGLALGSFAAAQVWRLRAGQLEHDKKHGEKYDKAQHTKLNILLGRSKKTDRSICLECKHQLAWYDLMPLVSWLSLGGRCRYCHQNIGWFETLMESGLAVLFVVSYLAWPFALGSVGSWFMFIIWLVSLVLVVMMAAYDIKWQLLLNNLTFGYIALAVVFVVVRAYSLHDIVPLSLFGSLLLLPGLYAVLYVVSRGRWIGDGDIILAVGLALFLGDWGLAFLALFLANLIGTVVTLPAVLSKRLKGTSKIAFGPFLLAGTVISMLYGTKLIDWFMHASIFTI